MSPRRALPSELLLRAAVIVTAVAFALPYVVMLTASFRPSGAINAAPLSPFGGGWSFDNYAAVLDTNDFSRYYVNSVVVTVAIVFFQVILGVLAAFALGHLRPFGSRAIRVLIVAVLSIPEQALIIPNYLTLQDLSLLDSRWSLILPFAVSAFGIYFLTEYVLSLPRDQLDAARMFGLGPWDRLRRMVLPHIRPAIVAFAAFSFVGYWNIFFWPLIVLNDDRLATVPFSVRAFLNVTPGGLPDWGPMMAAGTLALLPLLLLLVLVQRSFANTLSQARL